MSRWRCLSRCPFSCLRCTHHSAEHSGRFCSGGCRDFANHSQQRQSLRLLWWFLCRWIRLRRKWKCWRQILRSHRVVGVCLVPHSLGCRQFHAAVSFTFLLMHTLRKCPFFLQNLHVALRAGYIACSSWLPPHLKHPLYLNLNFRGVDFASFWIVGVPVVSLSVLGFPLVLKSTRISLGATHRVHFFNLYLAAA